METKEVARNIFQLLDRMSLCATRIERAESSSVLSDNAHLLTMLCHELINHSYYLMIYGETNDSKERCEKASANRA